MKQYKNDCLIKLQKKHKKHNPNLPQNPDHKNLRVWIRENKFITYKLISH